MSLLTTLRDAGGGVSYLYRDEFTTDRAAGAIDGTPIEPDGGANRAVTDTGSRATIADGWLRYEAGVAYGDPGYWLDVALPRTAGRSVVSKVRPMTNDNFMVGWDSDKSAAAFVAARFQSSSRVSVYDGGNSICGTYSIDQEYDITVIMRVLGCHYFIRGGTEYPQQTLLFSTETYTTTPLYATLNGQTMQMRAAYLRIPDELWLPTPLVSDGFSAWGASDGLGHREGVLGSALGQGGDGVSWTDAVGTWAGAGSASPSALDGGVAIATCPTAKNVNLWVDPTRTAGEVGVIVRYADASNYVVALHDGTDLILRKVVAGTPTDVDSYTGAAATIRVNVSDTRFQVFAGATRRLDSTISDAALQTGTACGLYSTDTGNSLDYFQVWSRT